MKKLLAGLLMVVLVMSFVGCGDSSKGSEEATVFKIGSIGPLTGPAASYGMGVKNGMEIAVDEINAAGGINGVPIELRFEDDEHDAEKSVNAYNTLKDWNMQILAGTVTSAPCLAVAEKTFEDNVFQLTPSGSAKECTQHPNVFRICFSDPDQGIASAQYIAEHKLGQKIAIIYDSSDVYSSGVYEKFVSEAPKVGLDVVATEAFTSDNKTDFSTQLQKSKDADADLVFIPIYYSEAALILQQADTMGFAPTFFGCDGLDGILSVDNYDKSLAEGVMLLTPFSADATDELTVNYVKNYKEKTGGEVPNQFSADAYDAIYAIKAAIEKADLKPSASAQEISDALQKTMLEIEVDGLTGAGMVWTADGEPHKSPKAVIIKDGAYVGMQ